MPCWFAVSLEGAPSIFSLLERPPFDRKLIYWDLLVLGASLEIRDGCIGLFLGLPL